MNSAASTGGLYPLAELEDGHYVEGSGITNSLIAEHVDPVLGQVGRKAFSDGKTRWMAVCESCGGLECVPEDHLPLSGRSGYAFPCPCGKAHSVLCPVHIDGIASRRKAREIEALQERFFALLNHLGFSARGYDSSLQNAFARLSPESGTRIPKAGPLRELAVFSAVFSQMLFRDGEVRTPCAVDWAESPYFVGSGKGSTGCAPTQHAGGEHRGARWGSAPT